MQGITRRTILGTAAGLMVSGANASQTARPGKPFQFMLNTSTIMGQKLPLMQQIEVAAKAGYDAIEPWVRDIDQFIKDGGKASDVKKKVADLGLTMESAIGFFEWIVDDEVKRQAALEQAKKTIEVLNQMGGKRLAAPPSGATNGGDINLLAAAQRYRALIDLGQSMGIIPMVEMWGFSKNLSRLGEAALVAIESKHQSACVLADVYHLYKGGSDFEGLKQLGSASLQVFHMNDYPGNLDRKTIQDKDRVYPGDGAAPLVAMLKTMKEAGFRGFLSLELFNRDYWMQDANLVAKTGLEKLREVANKAVS